MGRLQVDCALPGAANLSFCEDKPESEDASFAQASVGLLKVGYDVVTRNPVAIAMDLAVIGTMIGLELVGPPNVVVLNRPVGTDAPASDPNSPNRSPDEIARDEAAKSVKEARDAAKKALEEAAKKEQAKVGWGGVSMEAGDHFLIGGAAATLTARQMIELQPKDAAVAALPAALAGTGIQINAMGQKEDGEAAAERAAIKEAADAAKAAAEAAKQALKEAARTSTTNTKTKTYGDE